MLICPKCGHDNQLGRIFCHGCGDRLDLSSIKPPTAAEKKRRGLQRGAVHMVRVLLNVVVAAGLILVISLICLTPVVVPVQSTTQELLTSDAKRIALDRLANGRKSGQVAVSEGQLNAFFNQKPFAKATGQGIELVPVALRATLSDDCVKIEFLGTAHFSTYFDKNLYLGYEGRPTVTGGQFVFQPTGGWIGKLPIHPFILTSTAFLESRFARLFSELGSEKALLAKLTEINVAKGFVTFVMSVEPAR